MKLPAVDARFLNDSGISYRTFDDGSGMLSVELLDLPLPQGLSSESANVLFRLSANYPDAQPDMWWLIPHLTTATGGVIAATEIQETFDGRVWQRWSRHLDAGAWRPGVDSLESYVRLLRNELSTAAA
ncbi:E2/UBC family protein [Williamsia herbipolensis]|uniref:E2/UBC family protein n=1 Tax=Williamsia herbipolensis TaxID=1603258 RepID=UPI0006960E7A|nr:E2/UBC family protein [Williamsia herbipolensis]